MARIFASQRAPGGKAIFRPQAATFLPPPILLSAGTPTTIAATSSGGAVIEIHVFVDEPAPHSRCIFMDYQNRTIRL